MELRKKRAVFSGTARNCAWFLPNVLRNMEQLAALYSDAAFVVAENDSEDDTKSMLRAWLGAQSHGKLIELDGLDVVEPRRTQRIAAARNALLDYIRSDAIGSWDHLIMLDFDDVNAYPISSQNFLSAANFLEQNSITAGVFANQSTAYYDIYALRHESWCPNNPWKEVAARPRWMRWAIAKILYVYRRQFPIPEQMQPIRVNSAFGGLALYKMPFIADCRYEGLENDGTDTCEHVAFNQQIRERGGELYIYPKLLNQSPSDHLFIPSQFGRRDILVMDVIRLWQTIFPPWKRLNSSLSRNHKSL